MTASSLRKNLLAYYFSNPEQRLYLRELARQIRTDPGNLSKELKRRKNDSFACGVRRGKRIELFDAGD